MSERFPEPSEEALSSSIDRLVDEGLPPEAAVEGFADEREELLALLAVAEQLREAGAMAPQPADRQRARARLEARLAQSSRPPLLASANGSGPRAELISGWLTRLQRRWLQPRWRYALAGLLVILFLALGGVVGTAQADAAMPGEWLYPLDRALEEARLALTRDVQEQTRLHLQFASERLGEAQRLVDAGDRDNLQVALGAYGEQLRAVAGTTMAESAARAAARAAAKEAAQAAAQQAAAQQEAEEEAAGATTGTTGDEAPPEGLRPFIDALTEELPEQEARLEAIYEASNGHSNCEAAREGDYASLAAWLAAQYDQPEEVVAAQLCAGVPFGQLMLALATAQAAQRPLEDILSLRQADNQGWGQLWQELGGQGQPGTESEQPELRSPAEGSDAEDNGHGRPEELGPPPGQEQETGRPEGAGEPGRGSGRDEQGPPDHAGPPDDRGQGNGGGPPDHAGPPEDRGQPDHAGRPEGKPKKSSTPEATEERP